MTKTVSVCGFSVSVGTLDQNISIINSRAESKSGAWVVTLNTEMISRSASDHDYHKMLMTADIIVADGMPIIWSARSKLPNITNITRTTGVDIVEANISSDNPIPFSIIGGVNPSGVFDRYPKSKDYCKYLYSGVVTISEDQVSEFVARLSASQTKIVYLALGVPKQDILAKILRNRLPQLVFIGVGGTFEILDKDGLRAPKHIQNLGLEWLFRFMKDPKRLWKRYLLRYPKGVLFLIRDSLSKKN